MKNNEFIGFVLVGILAVGLQADFVRDNTKNIVKDNSTLLEWQDDLVVRATARKWVDAITYCESLTLGGYDDWRLPNLNELRSITDQSKISPSLSPVFINFDSNIMFSSNSYWSSTTYGNNSNYALSMSAEIGLDEIYSKTDSVYVRCVRAGQ